ncbi:MAG: SDR family oxidoreductase [Burkholderiales bacterium]|nr:SDR family oxidoreductase [Burkholderiales bacterium]
MHANTIFAATALADQHVVVLGGTSGIGRAVAEAAAAAGAKVTLMGRSATADGPYRAITVDVTDVDSLRQAFGQTGPIDHLVVTAGARGASVKLTDLATEDLQQTFGVKLFGMLLAVQQALPVLTPHASITLTSGLLSRKFSAGSLLKSTANAAVEAAGKQLAKELAPRRVNVVSPGVIDTALWGAEGSEARVASMVRIGQGLPLGRVGQPNEVAMAYLLAMSNGFMTGAVLDVEGGGLL